ncbi:Zinc finger protein 641-like [Homarus americanus]|uniref:Zinc finger protein 641-like n=1 Tax=Homarus americanus TaxID=6706 RepID=A0A8J5K0G2_HOMAM|nr:Zinc finger protein 641-like [Homarus americanus]
MGGHATGAGAGVAGEMEGYGGDTLRALECPECGKLFYGRNRRQLVDRHRIIHTGERPFQCPLCFKRMNVKHHLTRHLRTVHLNQWEYLKKLNLV